MRVKLDFQLGMFALTVTVASWAMLGPYHPVHPKSTYDSWKHHWSTIDSLPPISSLLQLSKSDFDQDYI